MATQTGTQQQTDFGQVSRTKGIIFKNALLASALIGIVSLATLLVYVTLDAVRPETASTGWSITYLAYVLVALGTVGYFSLRNREGLQVGFSTTGLPIAGVMLGAAILVIFVDVLDDDVWFYHMVGFALAGALVYAHRKLRSSSSAYERLLVGLVVFGYVMLGIPGYFYSVPEILLIFVPFEPVRWFSLLSTFSVAAAILTGRYMAGKYDSQRTGLIAGALVFGASLVSTFAFMFAGLDPSIGTIFALTVGVPTALYVEHLYSDPESVGSRSGLLIPVVVLAGLLVVETLVGVLGFAGPEAWIDWQFLTSLPHPEAEQAGIYPALVGSVMLMAVVVVLAFPIGVGAAVYLEEYAPDNRYTRFIQLNIANLAGVPSVVYGLLGLGLFINFLNMGIGSVLVGGITLSLLILPIVIISSQEAIRAVPDSLRQASYGMGATKWQTIREVVLPRSIPGILTGTILAIGRALGETAPLIMIAAPTVTYSVPAKLSDAASAMPLMIFNWADRPQDDFQYGVLAAGVVTVLVVLLTMNSIAIVLRNRYQSEN
ncbi:MULTISPECIES: phosphate ABC transporter permease PstA [unclassified Haladaptatus]|uniref:phosphate ABC transporter permease PstA n=1 Tax=unclassified Haladaptatus TaxID=2622732 RepID=UPI0023E78ACC|nr:MULTISPECIES: phosphate ABC transporter permease PstA [unclassified Haladaptatus]